MDDRTKYAAWIFLVLWASLPAFAGTNEWTRLGEGLDGRVNAVAFHPDRPDRLYAGAQDGFYRSDDGGATWKSCGPDLVGRSVLSLAVDPGDTTRLYAGLSDGVYFSEDMGDSWQRGEGLDVGVFSLAVGRETDHRLYAGTFGRGVYISLDQGRTWQEGSGETLSGKIVFAVATTPLEPGAVYAGAEDGLYVGRDGGGAWGRVGAELQGESVRCICLPSRSDEAGSIWVGTFGSGVWHSLDRGDTWQAMNQGLTDLSIRDLAVDEDFPQLMYAATSAGGFFRSTDGGMRWSPIDASLPSLAARRVRILPGRPKRLLGTGAADGVWEIHFTAEPQIAIDQDQIDFGRGEVGSTLRFELKIGNAGDADLHLTHLSVEGNSSFSVVPDHIEVPPGGQGEVSVRFSPQSRGDKRARLIAYSDDPDDPRLEIALHGVGTQGELSAAPPRIGFGRVPVGSFEDTAVVLTNEGNADLYLSNAFFEEGPFRLLSFQPGVLQPGRNAVLPVRFLPLMPRGFSSELVVVFQGGSLRIPVDGMGTASMLTLSSASVDFGTVDLYRPSVRRLEISNSGNAVLTVRSVELEGEAFSVDLAPPFELAPGQIDTVEVVFRPLVSGKCSGLLTILSDAPGQFGRAEVRLSGTGGGLALEAQPPLEAGEGPSDLLVADWNQDGAADLAVADSVRGEVRILLNDGAGDFPESAVYPGFSSLYERWDHPSALAAAPIYGSAPDLIVADPVARSISILENQGDGSFDLHREDLFIGHRISDVVACDLDADGDVDIAVANEDTGSVTLLFNNGEGSFNARLSCPVEEAPSALAAAHLNADGYLDLVVANRASGTVSVLFSQKRSGAFEPRRDFVVGLEPVDLVLVDYDADGDNDILTANQGMRNVSVLENDPEEESGSLFRLAGQVQVGMPVAALAASDLTADVFSDLIAVGPEGDFIRFLENEAGERFTVREGSLEAEGPESDVEIADVDGDGANDVAVVGEKGVQVFLNRDVRRLDPPRPPTGVEARDLGRDLGRQIEVLWEAPDLDEQIGRTTEYVIFRSESREGPFSPIDTVSAGHRRFTDRAATLSDTFYYYVQAGNAALHSAPSDTVWAVSQPAPFFELELVDEPRVSIGDTLKVRAFLTPVHHRIAGISLYLTFSDQALELVADDTLNPRPFRLASEFADRVVENRVHPRTTQKIDLSLANLRIEPGVDPVFVGEVWFVTRKDTVSFISIDDEDDLNRRSSVVEDSTGAWILPFIPKPTRVAVKDYQVSGQVRLSGRTEGDLGVQVTLLFVDERGDTLKSPLNDEDRLKPGIQYCLDDSGRFRLVQIPRGKYQVLVKAPTHLQGRVSGDTISIGDTVRTHLTFRWEGADSSLASELLPAGDGNDDNRVNLADFGVLVRYFGRRSADRQVWPEARAVDFNGDGAVDNADFFLLADHFGKMGMEVMRPAARAAALPGRVRAEGGRIFVEGLDPIAGFAVRVPDADAVEVRMEQTLWPEGGMRIFQWKDRKGTWVAGTLVDPEDPAPGEGLIARIARLDGGPVRIDQAELLLADGQVVRYPVARARPQASELLQNFPNPFNPDTTIPFVVGTSPNGLVRVRLDLFNALGQKVRTLVDGNLPPGRHQARWDGRDQQGRELASGLYFCRLRTGGFSQTRALLLLR